MQIRAITINAADMMAAEQSIQGNGFPGTDQAQTGNGAMFGPECKVTISQEGRNLSRQQTAQAETKARSTQTAQEEKKQLQQQWGDNALINDLIDIFRESGLEGDRLIDRVNSFYQDVCREAEEAKGDLQFFFKEPTDEEMAAVKRLAQKSNKVNIENIEFDLSKVHDLIQTAQEYHDYRILNPGTESQMP